jgi:hypothetical protein
MKQRMNIRDFYLHSEHHKVTIHWTTMSEVRKEYFTIERSVDGQHWSDLVSVRSFGKSDLIQNYSLTDENPCFGTSYYRLKYRNDDGQIDFSPPITAICIKAEDASLVNSTPCLVDSEL